MFVGDISFGLTAHCQPAASLHDRSDCVPFVARVVVLVGDVHPSPNRLAWNRYSDLGRHQIYHDQLHRAWPCLQDRDTLRRMSPPVRQPCRIHRETNPAVVTAAERRGPSALQFAVEPEEGASDGYRLMLGLCEFQSDRNEDNSANVPWPVAGISTDET